MYFFLYLMYLQGLILTVLINGVLGFWAIDINKNVGPYNLKWGNLHNIETGSINPNNSIVNTLCIFSFGFGTPVVFNPSEYGGCKNQSLVSLVGQGSTLYYLQHQDGSKIGCTLSRNDSDFDSYLCADKFPIQAITTTSRTTSSNIMTKTTSSTTGTKTTSSKTSTTTVVACKSGYSGKKNGGGPTGACCTSSDDCLDTCNSNNICGVHP